MLPAKPVGKRKWLQLKLSRHFPDWSGNAGFSSTKPILFTIKAAQIKGLMHPQIESKSQSVAEIVEIEDRCFDDAVRKV